MKVYTWDEIPNEVDEHEIEGNEDMTFEEAEAKLNEITEGAPINKWTDLWLPGLRLGWGQYGRNVWYVMFWGPRAEEFAKLLNRPLEEPTL